MTDGCNWTPPFRADDEWVIDAAGVTVIKAMGMGMRSARAKAIAAALNEMATRPDNQGEPT